MTGKGTLKRLILRRACIGKRCLVLRNLLLLFVFLGTVGSCPPTAGAMPAAPNQDTFTLCGRVTDRVGNGVAGAEVALYTNSDVRRPVDFLAPSTNEDGGYAIAVPPGKYWVVARQRRSGRYGPLQPTDRHSGAPIEIVGKASETVTVDFTVATLREMSEKRRAPEGTTVTLRGRLIDKKGLPAEDAYLFARREKTGSEIPDFISPASDGKGESTLILPPGRYLIGASVAFPPREGGALREVTLAPGKKEVFIEMEVPQ